MLEQQALINKVLGALDDPVAVFDKSYRFIWYNDAYKTEVENIVGVLLDGKVTFDTVFANHPLGRDTVRSYWKRTLSGETFSVEYDYLNHDTREQVYFRLHYKPLRDIKGNVVAGCAMVHDITAWKSKTNELRKQEELFQDTARLAKIGSWELDANSLDMVWSDTIYQLLEFDPRNKTTLNKSIDFYDPQGRQSIRRAINNCLERGEHFDVILPLTSARGKKIWARTMGKPDIRRGRIERVYGIFQDITEQYLYEEKIKESEQRLKNIIDNAPAFIYIKDLSGKYVMVNKQYETRFERPEELILGNRLEDLVSPDIAGKLDELDIEVLNTEKLSVKKEFITIHDKQSVFITTRFPVYNIEGSLSGVCGISTDVTEVINLRSQLSKNNELLSLIFDTAEIYYASVDEEMVITFMNAAWLKEIGAGEVSGKHMFDVLSSLKGSTFEEAMFEVFYSKQPKVVEYYMPENRHWYESSINPTEDGGIHIFSRNITANKEAETTVKQINNQLTSLNTKLTKQNKQLEEFAHITSHNLRAPVANLVALIEIFENAETEEEREASIKMLRQATHNTYDVLNELTEVLRIQSQQAGKAEDLKLDSVLEEVIRDFNDYLKETKAVIEYDFSAASVVQYPKEYIENVFRELIVNAVRFRKDSESPHIRISSQHSNNRIILTFTDNGTGIDLTKNATKIFKMHKTFHRNKGGKGLGLFIIKNQLESLGGEIEVSSKVDEGSTFKVKI